ncbi:hypothetical protein FG135_18740 [Vibrio cholerae]|uniref:STM4504/CBY_0614 family protein n=1 Tax=Vibrio cholerae TaxID=666 RepID=UPI0008519081|nr:hypothetical protein [Vibrio cholerae]EGR0659888.1 hypothetical protein [Vibrio cholerae]EGR5155588.1 hypothetical protein [Vibrio cholerae]EJL6300112.1 hypothetical protein [Vibrio cholerae]EJL6637469.1 hypothetical protein [Vibrio cholerae]EJL6880587.1 hypothetical protein [Vibrio cholerae]
MGMFDLFSKRQKRLRGDVPDVYSYDLLPEALRVQIIHIWGDSLGNNDQYWGVRNVRDAYKFIVDTLCREYGLFQLPSAKGYGDRQYMQELSAYLLEEQNVEKQLDVVELTFKVINKLTRKYDYMGKRNAPEVTDDAIDELNQRFKEHGVGFQFTNNEIFRVDSELLHVETVKPALRLLNQNHYEGAQQEFLLAYEHYRHGRYKESLNDCLKAFESTMKSICDKRGWQYQANATSKSLIKVCFDNELVPAFWQQQMTSLRSLLESSIPTGRNKLSGHGQGSETIEIPDHFVAYMLHMTASTLVFLATAEEKIA